MESHNLPKGVRGYKVDQTSEGSSSSIISSINSSYTSRKDEEENNSPALNQISTSGVVTTTSAPEYPRITPDPLASTLAGENLELVRTGMSPLPTYGTDPTNDSTGVSRRLSSSTFLREKAEIHQTFYSIGGGEDDDVTFVDHGSTTLSIFPRSAPVHPLSSEPSSSYNLEQCIGHSNCSVGGNHGARGGQDQSQFYQQHEKNHLVVPAMYQHSETQYLRGLESQLVQGISSPNLVGNGTTSFPGPRQGDGERDGTGFFCNRRAGDFGLTEGGGVTGVGSVRNHPHTTISATTVSASSALSNSAIETAGAGTPFIVSPATNTQPAQPNELEDGAPSSFSGVGLSSSAALRSHSSESQISSSTIPHNAYKAGEKVFFSSYSPQPFSMSSNPQSLHSLQSSEYPPTPSGGSPSSNIPPTPYSSSPIPEDVKRMSEAGQKTQLNGFGGYAQGNLPIGNSLPGAPVLWHPPRVLSQMRMNQNVRAMTVAPDGKSVWIAIGDDPLTLLEVEGRDLVISRAIDTITQVYCVAVVKIAGSSHKCFKSVVESSPNESSHTKEEGEGKRKKSKNSRAKDTSEDSYFLWCGLNKGHISIWDLQQHSDMGYIRNAHSTTLQRIWQLPNGNVWTSGLDKAVKVWDAQSRRKIKNRNIAVILQDICYVTETSEVWGIASDNVIRVYEAGGDNARIKQTGENTIKMKSDLSLIRYNEDANLIWAGMTKGTALIRPTTYEVECYINLTVSAIAFLAKTAIVTGRGSLLESESTDRVALLDITNPLEPTPLFIGSTMEGVTSVGMHLFPASPLALVAQDLGRYQKKSITVFTYKETVPIGKNLSISVPQDSPRRMNGYFRGFPSPVWSASGKQAVGYVSAGNTGGGGASAVGIDRQGAAGRWNSPGPSREGGSDPIPPRSAPLTVDFHGAPLTASQAALATSPVMFEFLEDIERNTKETKNFLAMLTHGQKPAGDVIKLQNTLTEWLLTQPTGALPSLTPEETEQINKEYSSSEGKVLALGMAQLQKGLISARRALSESVERENPPSGYNSSISTAISGRTSNVEGTRNTIATPANDYLLGRSHQKGEKDGKASTSLSVPVPLSSVRMNSGAYTLESSPRGGEIREGTPPQHSTTSSPSAPLSSVSQQLSAFLSSLGSTEQQNSFQRQIELFQSYNRRTMERQQAFVLGLTRIDQAICTVAQQLLDEMGERLGPLNTGSTSLSPQGTSFFLLHQTVADALQRHHEKEGIVPSSTSLEIRDFSRRVVKLFHSVVLIRQLALPVIVSSSSCGVSSSSASHSQPVRASGVNAVIKKSGAVDSKKPVNLLTQVCAARESKKGDSTQNSNAFLPGTTPTTTTSTTSMNSASQGTSPSSALGLDESAHKRMSSEDDSWKSVKSVKEKPSTMTRGDNTGCFSSHFRQSSTSSVNSKSGETSIASLFSQPVSCTQLENFLTQHHFSPGEASRLAASLLSMTADRFFVRLKEELTQAQSFIDQLSQVQRTGEAFRRMVYNQYKEGKAIPTLESDPMQFLPLMDFKKTKRLFDICMGEGYISTAESFLASHHRSSSNGSENELSFILSSRSSLLSLFHEREREEHREQLTESLRYIAQVSSNIENISADIRNSLLPSEEEKVAEDVIASIRAQCGGFLLTDLPPSAIQQKEYQGAVFWADVALILMTECLEAVEALLFPAAQDQQSSTPRHSISLNNLSLITEELLDWDGFTRDVEKRFYQFQLIILLCSLESKAVLEVDGKALDSRRSSSTSSSSACQNRKGGTHFSQWSIAQRGSSAADNLKERKRKEVKKKEDLRALLHRSPQKISTEGDEATDLIPSEEEPQLRFLTLLLYVQKRVYKTLRKSYHTPKKKSRRLAEVFPLDAKKVTTVIQKCVFARRYAFFLLQRAKELRRDVEQVVDADGTLLLLIPPVLVPQQEQSRESSRHGIELNGLSAEEKSFCKVLGKP